MAAVEVIEVPEFEELDQGRYLHLVSVGTTPRVLRTGRTLAQRRAARLRMIQRRRRTAIALLLVIGLVILAWPGHAFGSTTNTGLSNARSVTNFSSGRFNIPYTSHEASFSAISISSSSHMCSLSLAVRVMCER